MTQLTIKERIQLHITATIRAIDSAQDADYKAFQQGKLYGLKEALFIIEAYEVKQHEKD